jgi:hypothetical protein
MQVARVTQTDRMASGVSKHMLQILTKPILPFELKHNFASLKPKHIM